MERPSAWASTKKITQKATLVPKRLVVWVVWWWCGGGGVVVVCWWCGGGVVVVWWWCGGGVVVWWCVVCVVCVVQMIKTRGSLSCQAPEMQLIRVAEHLGASSRRPRHPFPALMAGEPLAVYLCTRPKKGLPVTS